MSRTVPLLLLALLLPALAGCAGATTAPTSSAPTNVQGWMLSQASSCAPQRVLEGLGSAEVWLAVQRDPPATTVELLVMELGCNSGQDASGRVRAVEQVEAADTVELLVAVEPRTGDATCQGNPATPFTVTLDQPLGDRTVVDTSVYPPRPLAVAPADLWTGG